MRYLDRTLSGGVFGRLVVVAAALFPLTCIAGEPGPTWLGDYGEAVHRADEQGKMLLIVFHAPEEDRLDAHFQSRVLADPQVQTRLGRYVCARLPVDATIRAGGEDRTLLDDPSMAGLEGRRGVAVLDYAHKQAPYYGCVVGAFPFGDEACYSAEQMKVVLDLPAGTPDERHRRYVQTMRDLAGQSAAGASEPPREPAELEWLTDYPQAYRSAERQERMLLVFFCQPDEGSLGSRFEREVLAHPEVRRRLAGYVAVKVPLDARVDLAGQEEPAELLKTPAFAEMLGREGLAILDFVHKERKHYGCVVSTFPFLRSRPYNVKETQVMLDLPPGTLTQRTLIYAVRTHPDKPASTSGKIDPTLVEEAESHSDHQARIRLQGHHNWETRFHRINARLGGGLLAKEVCAESWPGENLVEAAVECVRCWRLSSGHWSAVRAAHQRFGYDMKRGANGIWYATGIFGSP